VEDPPVEATARAVLEVLALEDEVRGMTARAARWIKSRTWERRIEAILDALGL
jgi:hypothetical protein